MVVLYEGSGRMFFGMMGHVSLYIANTEGISQDNAEIEVDEALRKAWLALRYAHPTLAYEGNLLPSRHQRLALTLTEQETQQLLTACKRVGATPTHVFHAAAAIVVRDLQDKPAEVKRVRYINYILRNERSSCQEPYNTTQHPASVYHSVSGQSLVVDMDLRPASTKPDSESRQDEFVSILETVKDFYLTVKRDKEFYILAPTMFSQATPSLPSGPHPLPVPPPNARPSVSISSMGCTDALVAPEIGAFMARDPWVTGEELGNGLGLFLGTF
ncbi:hypothetical protein IL306_009520 [Fusarium sp. DS 682]|nr:hypothetical protein IL306_009520 [Fusarium sp. DS 682]